jgi:hypothetical protein
MERRARSVLVAPPWVDVPHDAPFSNQAVSSQGDNDGMAASSSPQVTPNNCAIRDNRLASEDDVLWPSDNGLARYLVPGILKRSSRVSKCDKTRRIFQGDVSKIASCAAFSTYRFNILVAGVIYWLLHPWKTVFWRQSGWSSIGAVLRNGRAAPAGTGELEGRAPHVTWEARIVIATA